MELNNNFVEKDFENVDKKIVSNNKYYVNMHKLLLKYNDYILKNLASIIVFIILFAFDICVIVNVRMFYNKPFINKNHIRESGYTKSLARDGFIKVDNKYYYCDKDAIIVKDKIIKWNDNDYYLDKDGILLTNKDNYKINDDFYNIDSNGVLVKVK